jgi:hypothetical protein
MHKSELMRKIDDMASTEDAFIENLAAIDVVNARHLHMPESAFLKLKNGLTRLLDDSRRHREILVNMRTILAGDSRDEY